MPKFKNRITNRGDWSEENMKKAIQAVLENNCSERAAADRYEVPRTSLQDRIKCIKQGHQISLKPILGRFKQTFKPEFERQLNLDNRLMPLTRNEFLRLAFDLAEKIKIPHRFNKNKRMAGKDFFCDFKKRNPDMVLRTPEATSLMRATGFNKPQVDRFFDLLFNLYEKFNFKPSQIYNADETGVSTVHKNDRVLSMKGKKQVGKLTSAELGRNITVMISMSASGHFVPPLFIFPRKKMDKNGRLMIGAPPESIGIASESGWMNAEIFLQWLQHFKKHVHPSEAHPVLLVVDGHNSHKDLNVIEFARDNHIHMLSTPPHTTHKLQPLDRVFFKPFKQAYGAASALWMRQNPGARLTDYDIAGLTNIAFTKTARLEIAHSGFRCTGIQPFNRDVFSDLDFLGSALTDISNEDRASQSIVQTTSPAALENSPRPSTSALSLSSAAIRLHEAVPTSSIEPTNTVPAMSSATLQETVPSASTTSPAAFDNSPGPSASALPVSSASIQLHEAVRTLSVEPTNSVPAVSSATLQEAVPSATADVGNVNDVLKVLSPLPDASKKRLTARKRRTQKSEILTSSPYKKELMEKAEDPKAVAKVKKNMKAQVKAKKVVSKYENKETACIICGETFDEDWIQCKTCKDWAHEECVDINPSDLYYNCDVCVAKKRFGH